MKRNLKMTRNRPILTGLAAGLLATLLCLALAATPSAAAFDDTNPDFGPNVTIIDPSMSAAQINALIAPQASSPMRQIFFKPGSYGSAAGQEDPATATDVINATLNTNTAIAGLGKSPDDVLINGALHVEAPCAFCALGTFYRSLANLSINPIQAGMPAHSMRWLTSQTCHWRRVHLKGDVDLNDWSQPGGVYAFGSVFANSWIEGTLYFGDGRKTATSPGIMSQAMYFLRNSKIGGTNGGAAIFLFSGVDGAPATDFSPGDKVNVARTPVTREAPFLYLDRGHYKVFVPNMGLLTSGVNWGLNTLTGKSVSLKDFYIAKPTDTVSAMNTALAQGKNLILTPGAYNLDAPLQVTRPNTIVMGLGFAQLTATAGNAAVVVGDVPGVILANFNVNAGAINSNVLVQIGTPGVRSGSFLNPTALNDVHILVGRNALATNSEEINQNHVIIDGAWIKRGDSGWTTSLADHGIIVNGDNVTGLGLWVEHYQKTQILWNGEGGRVVFLQNEPPYDPPNQAAWMNGAKEGYPALKVADNVDFFWLNGFSTYARFVAGFGPMGPIACPDCFVSSAIEAPESFGVVLENMTAAVIQFPASKGGYRSIVNDYGPEVNADPFYNPATMMGRSEYPNTDVAGFVVNDRISWCWWGHCEY